MSAVRIYDLTLATAETLYMTGLSTFITVLVGLPLGTLLFTTHTITPKFWLYRIISGVINFSRSVPFIILLVALIPITRKIVGTSIGTNAAIIPLTLGAIPFFARLVHNAYQQLPKGLIDTGVSLGASTLQMIRFLFLPEACPALIQAITVTAITLVNYSAMAGTVGGGGLGDLAIRYGYQRFDPMVMLITVLLLVAIVQILQWLGDFLARHYQH